MSHREDSAYYWLRAAEELRRSDEAANEAAAAVHRELAYRYGTLADGTGADGHDLILAHGGRAA